MSRFFELRQELEECMCSECEGSGIINDAEPGDTQFDIWECAACAGSGINPEKAISLDIEG